MDWEAAIGRNREALLRIVAALFALAGLAEGRMVPTLPRHLRNHVLRLLRPAESAVRRLILIAARDAFVPAPRREPNEISSEEQAAIFEEIRLGRERMRRMETGQAAGIVYRQVNLGIARWADPRDVANKSSVILGLDPRTHSVKPGTPARIPAFPLLDPLKRFERNRVRYGKSIPRITDILGHTGLREVLEPPQPSPDDPISAANLCRRLIALKRALDDIDGQAKRLARWQARRALDFAPATATGQRLAAYERESPELKGANKKRPTRTDPLRPGFPPGRRKRPVHEIDAVLAECHRLALHAERADTS